MTRAERKDSGQRCSFQDEIQNDSVPLSANMSTSWRGTCVNEQLPSGLRTKAPGR
jgi:hypothetical protein